MLSKQLLLILLYFCLLNKNMSVNLIICTLFTLCLVLKKIDGAKDSTTFSAVVVEYSPPPNPTLDPPTNILNNAGNYVDLINKANELYQVDIIVFPEAGLEGFYNKKVYFEIPDPKLHVRPCATDSEHHTLLVQLSCAARSAATYVVVNLAENFINESQQRTHHFNTDVVFDREGTVVARYRKIHLYGEGDLESPDDKALVYFDTDFGVRFGLLTCFDIIFKDPGVVLANDYNITHFIFPTAWFSQMPFLTAIQEQYYWAYTLDVVLLASSYNLPSAGTTGSGIFLGRQGPVIYNMTETTTSFMLHAQLPTQRSGAVNSHWTPSRQLKMNRYSATHGVNGSSLKTYPSQLQMKRDFVDVYSTELIAVPDDAQRILNGSGVIIPFEINRTICHNDLCCDFLLEVTVEFDKSEDGQRSRNDDYSQFYYRMAAFDGVRSYDLMDSGGLQTCAIIPCVNSEVASCGLLPHDTSSKPNSLLQLNQTKFTFQSIKITGNFSNNNSFVGPNVLLSGEYDNFGALLHPKRFEFTTHNITDDVVIKAFQTVDPIPNLVTASLYARLFSRDGQNYTGQVVPNTSSECHLDCLIYLLVVSLLCIKYTN